MQTDFFSKFNESMDSLEPFDVSPTIALGVSGGRDSMALLLCAKRWAEKKTGSVVALIVNHGLREEAEREAKQVASWVKNLGVKAHILKWEGEKPKTGIQEIARNARYNLLLSFCKKECIKHLLLAHQLEDQAETFLIRLGRGSGVDGLCAISKESVVNDIRILRPMLDFSRKEVTLFLEQNNQQWVDDPSNVNPHYTRIKMRNLLPVLEENGICTKTLASTALRMQRAKQALENITKNNLIRHSNLFDGGYVIADFELFNIDDEIALRSLRNILMCVGFQEYPPRLEKLERLLIKLREHKKFKGSTLCGCRIFVWQDSIVFCREKREINGEIEKIGQNEIKWDKRFKIKGYDLKKYSLKPLGEDGWKFLTDNKYTACKSVPRLAGIGFPAFFDDNGVLFVPFMGYKRNIKDKFDLEVKFCHFHSLTD